MFDNIGKDLDEEANKRRAASFLITVMGLAGTVGFMVMVGAYTAAEVLLEPTLDEMTEEIKELKEEVKEEMKSDVKPAGVEGGVEGGQVGGVVGGVLGGVEGGVLGGQLGGVRVFHHSELEVKKRVNPEYPQAAKDLNLGDQRCLAKVFMDEEGVPYEVTIENCPKVFETPTKEAMLKWRWYPPRDGKNKVKAQTTIAVTYKMK